jgi:exodeoxyribonuclease VII small subunit
MPDKQQEEIQKMDFETAFTALQENISFLESENLPLEKALDTFEKGQALAKRCAQLLEEAELKVRELSLDNPATSEVED